MKRSIVAIFLCVTVFSAFCTDFVIAEKGKENAVFEKNEKALSACRVFNEHLKKMGFAPLQIVEKGKSKGKVIRFQVIPSGDNRVDDEFSISFPDKNTLLISCTDISARWAVNHLLEKYAGIMHLFPEENGTYIPVTSKILLPRKAYKVKSSWNLKRFVERSHSSWYPKAYYKDNFDANHMFLKYVFPAAKYQPSLLKNHAYPGSTKDIVSGKGQGWPKEIMPVIKGKKLSAPPAATPNAWWQPCYSNPATAEIAAQNILEYLRKNPQRKSISLIQNDCYGACECKECMRVNKNDKHNNSATYFAWANNVVEKVAPEFPDVIFAAAGYTMTKTPPSFKLHKNIAVLLAMDLYACTAPDVMAAKKKYIDKWSEKASILGIWDYAWGWGYILPRVYFKVHAEMLRYLYSKGGRIYFSENECFDAKEGPKQALTDRLVWDMNTNVDAFLDKWCEKAVGKEAGKYLRKYYDFWEKFMNGEEIRKTPWFRTAYTSVYMIWDSDLSHIYSVTEKDILYSRSLMEKMLASAKEGIEKKRAELLFRHFEYMEVMLKLYGAALLPSSNVPENARQAAVFVEDMKNIPSLLKKRDELKKEFFREKKMGYFYQSRIYKRRIRFEVSFNDIVSSRLALVLNHSGEKEVISACKKLLLMKELDEKNRNLLEGLATFRERKNLLENGEMNTALPDEKLFWVHPGHRKKNSGILSGKMAVSGGKSLKILPADYTLLRFNVPAKPDCGILVSFKIRSEKVSKKGNFAYAVYPALDDRNQGWGSPATRKVPADKFEEVFFFTRTRNNSNAVNGYIFLRNFAGGEAVYIDDVKIVEFK